MKEIDFIPSWYHENRRRRNWYFRRYMAVMLFSAAWMIGNLISGGIISSAYGELDSLRSSFENGMQKIDQARKLEARLAELSRKQKLLLDLQPRTQLSPILAELSSCIGPRVVLTKVSVTQSSPETLETSRQSSPAGIQVRRNTARQESLVFSDSILKVVLAGIAADGAEAAALISRLDESEYFIRVVPVFSRNQSRFEKTVTEFEILCYVADFEILN